MLGKQLRPCVGMQGSMKMHPALCAVPQRPPMASRSTARRAGTTKRPRPPPPHTQTCTHIPGAIGSSEPEELSRKSPCRQAHAGLQGGCTRRNGRTTHAAHGHLASDAGTHSIMQRQIWPPQSSTSRGRSAVRPTKHVHLSLPFSAHTCVRTAACARRQCPRPMLPEWHTGCHRAPPLRLPG